MTDWTCLFTVSLTSSNRIIYFWSTCLLIALLPLLSPAYPIALDTSVPTRPFPMPETCTDRTFYPLKLNDSTTERWTKRDIFIIILGPGEVIYDLWVGADWHFCVSTEPASLHFFKNYPSSVSKSNNHGVEHWRFSIKHLYCPYVMSSVIKHWKNTLKTYV